MSLRKPSSRWALWAFAAALLLKSAMPWLASSSAQLQGKPLVEVCTVYGVSLLPQGGDGQAPEHPSDHGGEHCALSALTAFAAVEPAALVPTPMLPQGGSPPQRLAQVRAPDACAAWAARLRHAPPILA